jgi:predicted flap endonuclease-1-like 5' DNA nuclease
MTDAQEKQGESGTALPKIGAPAMRALASIGVTTVEDLAAYAEKDVLVLHGFGPRAIRILTTVMADLGVRFRDDAGTSGDQD